MLLMASLLLLHLANSAGVTTDRHRISDQCNEALLVQAGKSCMSDCWPSTDADIWACVERCIQKDAERHSQCGEFENNTFRFETLVKRVA